MSFALLAVLVFFILVVFAAIICVLENDDEDE